MTPREQVLGKLTRVPASNFLYAGTVPAFNFLDAGTVPASKHYHFFKENHENSVVQSHTKMEWNQRSHGNFSGDRILENFGEINFSPPTRYASFWSKLLKMVHFIPTFCYFLLS